MISAPVQKWEGCYDLSWKGVITDDSFAHPAKFSRGLIERIFDYCLERGYLRCGDLVGDAFGGIGTGGITAAYRGLRWIGVELEPRFIGMAHANFNLHRHKLAHMGRPLPEIIQGDSRLFHKLIAESSAMVSSPPYADSIEHKSGIDPDKVKKPGGPNGNTFHDIYGETAGQIGALSAGAVDSVVTSPPYAETGGNGGGGININGYVPAGGRVDAVATSPPYAPNEKHDHQMSADGKTRRRDQNPNKPQGRGCFRGSETYGDTDGQIGRESPETYWSAMDLVYRSCFQAIKPGGYLILVLKDYVKGGKRVPLCDDTCRLIEHIGFEVVERIHAMLTKHTRHSDLFDGETVSTKSRKSFFRRLAEKKGSPPIDFEQVVIARKPAP